jgi:hypothetical protein
MVQDCPQEVGMKTIFRFYTHSRSYARKSIEVAMEKASTFQKLLIDSYRLMHKMYKS